MELFAKYGQNLKLSSKYRGQLSPWQQSITTTRALVSAKYTVPNPIHLYETLKKKISVFAETFLKMQCIRTIKTGSQKIECGTDGGFINSTTPYWHHSGSGVMSLACELTLVSAG